MGRSPQDTTRKNLVDNDVITASNRAQGYTAQIVVVVYLRWHWAYRRLPGFFQSAWNLGWEQALIERLDWLSLWPLRVSCGASPRIAWKHSPWRLLGYKGTYLFGGVMLHILYISYIGSGRASLKHFDLRQWRSNLESSWHIASLVKPRKQQRACAIPKSVMAWLHSSLTFWGWLNGTGVQLFSVVG